MRSRRVSRTHPPWIKCIDRTPAGIQDKPLSAAIHRIALNRAHAGRYVPDPSFITLSLAMSHADVMRRSASARFKTDQYPPGDGAPAALIRASTTVRR